MIAESLLSLVMTCAPQIHPSTMIAVVHHESRANPYAIGINKGQRLARQPKTKSEATQVVRELMAKGVDFDAGLGQINVRNWGWLNLSADTVFEPCTNLKASQTVLADCYVRATSTHAAGQSALQAALSCYNTGNFNRGLKNGYVQRVYAAANQTVPELKNNAITADPPTPSTGANSSGKANDTSKSPEDDAIVKDGFLTQPSPDGFQPHKPATSSQ